MRRSFTFLASLALSCGVALAQSSVWEVRSLQGTTYLAGTCHVLRSSDYPLPKEFDHAYQEASVLVFETDLDEMNKPEVQNRLLRNGMYTDGTTLDQVLSAPVYTKLADHCAKAGIPPTFLKTMRAPLAVVTLTIMELGKLGVQPEQGVDVHFHRRAKADGKRVEGLESTSEQISMILNMGKGNEDKFVEYSLRDMDKLSGLFDEIVSSWKSGNEQQLGSLFVAEMRREAPDLYKNLFVDRNLRWLPKIEGYLKTEATEMLLVGVGHLAGNDSLLAHLRKRGFTVRQVQVPQAAPVPVH